MHKTYKIFILDKDTTYMTPLVNGLQKAGFKVICWEGNQKAIDIARDVKPDLIISEVDLPDFDTYDFFNEIRSIQQYKTVPFIFFSSQKKVDDRIKNIEIGIDDYISKPFYVEEVVSRVKNLLNEVSGIEKAQGQTEKGFSGNLTEMNLVDLIQTMELGKKSAVIKLKHQNSLGIVCISNGEVVDANLEDLPPDKAIMRMFTWTVGAFFVEMVSVKLNRRIEKSNKKLIDIGVRRVNDWEQIKQGLPPLSAIVVKTNSNNFEQLSDLEKELLSGIKNKVRIYDLIEQSSLDDLKTLELVRGLHQKGYLQETEDNYSHYVDDYLKRLKAQAHNGKSPSERAQAIVANLFKKETSQRQQRIPDRRQQQDRRKYGRRSEDRCNRGNPVYLTKAELLMLREALL
ncbi:hypothetical protein B6I21_04755 [candidate division KSB1 bacterium 4572_119]|nr:MAG: hypothetical protein B6I21_04755 [candidate division KSB1 bacterium 4572_119]